MLSILLLMMAGVGAAWGQNTVIADIDFSNPITDGVVAGRVNTMTIGDPSDISDGRLVLGNNDNIVTIPEQQRDGQLVTVSFAFAFGKLVNRYVNFYLNDADGNNIAYFTYQPYYNSLSTNLGITTADLPANDKNSPDWANRAVTFTITLNYYSNLITTRTSITNTDRTVSMSITNRFATFVVSSNYDNSSRLCQFDDLLIKSNTNYYSYLVKARVNSTYYSTIASGAALNGSLVTVPYHEFIQIDNNLYITSATNQEYRKTITLDNINGKEVFVDYTLNQENVLFFSEAEDIAGGIPSSKGNADVRCSYALGAYFPNDVIVSSFNAGVYRIWGQVQGNTGTTFSMTAGGSQVWSCATQGYLTSSGSNFTLTNPGEVVISAMGDQNHVIDCFYIQAIFAFKENGATYTLGETPNISSRLINTTGQTVTYSPSVAADDPVLAVAPDGTLTLKRTGRKIVKATVTVGNNTYTAQYLITVRSTTNATGALTYDEASHTESFTITGTGNFDVEHFEGERISFDIGNPNEVQQVNEDGLYCIADNGMIYANTQSNIPVGGTYFKFTPKASGVLTVAGPPTGNNLRLVDSEGNLLKTLEKNVDDIYTFDTQLQADHSYYVYSQDNWWAFFLKSFTFDATQSASTTINVSDLLYPTVEGGINSTGNKLDRFIPGFALTFSGGDGATVYNSNGITFYQNASGVGQMVISPRLMSEANEGDVVFTGITLNYATIASGKATSALVNGQTANMSEGSTSASVTLDNPASTIIVKYGSDTDDNSFVLQSLTLNYTVTGRELLEEVIDMSKTATQLSFENSVYYVSFGQPKGQQAFFDIPSGQQAYSYGGGFNGTITYSSADPSIATVAPDGTVTMVVNDGSETTINAQFEAKINGNEDHPYFLPSAVASYRVKSAMKLTPDNSYILKHVKRGMVVEAVVSSDGTSMLSFSKTIATSQQTTSSEGQLISTFAYDNEGLDTEFDVVISYVSGDYAYVQSARAYYKTPELRLNYTPQAIYNHHGNWTDSDLQTKFAHNTGVVSCFDLQGIPSFTAYYEDTDCSADFVAPTAASEFSKTGNIAWVTDPETTPKATIRSNGSGTAITDATVSAPISLKPTAMGYDPTAANNVATANLPVIPFPYTWDLTTGEFAAKTKALELVNITDDGNAYVLLGPGSVAVHETVIIAGREKPKTNYEIDPSRPNSRLRIPVMQGMKVSITSYGAEERVTGVQGYPLQVSNVTDLRGYATATLDIKQTSNTQEYIAKDDGYVEIYNRSDVNVFIQSITVSAPYLVFADGDNPKISKTTTYQNLVVNKPTKATLTFEDNDDSNAKIDTRDKTTGTYTFQSSASGDIVVTAKTTEQKPAKNLEPCWGQYTISLVDFYFSPNVVNLNHSVQSVSYPTNMFLSYAHLYFNGKDWLNMTAEEKSKISFSVAAPAYIDDDLTRPNFAEGIVKVNNDVNNPYTMEVRNDGQLIITAVYRENNNSVSTVKTSCKVNITMTAFNGFKYPAPIIPSNVASYTFATDGSDNPLDATALSTTSGYNVYYIGKDNNQEQVYGLVTWNGTTPSLDLETKGSGVYCVVAVRDDGGGVYTPIASFYLTKAYPVNQTTSQSWDFRNGLHNSFGEAWDNKYNDLTLFERQGDWTRGMPSNRASDYRYLWSVNGNNGFIIRETAGLLVIADAPTCDNSIIDGAHCDGHFGAYSGTKGNYVYPNIGLHRSTLIIPHLPKGAYVAVAWDRTSEGDGNTMVLENLLDLEGHTIDEIRYGGSVRLIGTNAGNNQGYYTFRVAHDGNVTFTQNDKGTSRIIAIHVYYGNPDTNVNASDDVYYNRNATEEFKGSGMTQKIMAYARANADGTADVGSGLMQLDGILTTEGETTSQWLTNYLNFSAPNGVPEFKMVNQDETLHNMTMDMSQTYFDSGNGRYAVPGLSFVGACWGKAVMSVGVRDNNGYLVAYRQYRFTVGMRPNMTYPKTWDFTRFFDNSTVKIEDSPVTVLPATANLNTKNSLIENVGYPDNTENMAVLDTSPTSTWDFVNDDSSFKVKRKSGTETYHQYGYNDYSSYYVDDAVLVCNLGDRNNKGFVIEETKGLGFSIEPEDDEDTSKKLEWAMPNRNVGYAENTYLKINGTITIAAVGESYEGYYVFLKSDRAPDACSENLKAVNSGEYRGIVSNNEGQYIFEVNSPENMTMTFSSDTKIYGIGVTNIKKDAIHPVGGIGWATESRTIDIDYALTGYYTRHPLKAYEVKYDSYDMNTATVYLTEIKNTAKLTDSKGVEFYDHGYVAQNNGIVLKEVQTDEASPYVVPLFVPAITTTHPADISDNNMMHPNIIRKEFHVSDVADNDNIFILTNVHWKYSVDSEWSKDGDNYVENRNGSWQDYGAPTNADAAGFYRLHIWEDPAANTMAANTAYLLVDSDDLPIALWNSSTANAQGVRPGTIGIRELGVVDGMDEVEAGSNANGDNGNDAWYTLDGMKLNGQPTKSGLYIHNGRKVVK